MAQKFIDLPNNQKGILIYPDNKKLDRYVYQPTPNNVIVYYQAPYENAPDLAVCKPGTSTVFVVPGAY